MIFIDIVTGTWGDAEDIFFVPDSLANDDILENGSDWDIKEHGAEMGEHVMTLLRNAAEE